MHGLIFETSVCYWQDQPDFYSSVPLAVCLCGSSLQRRLHTPTSPRRQTAKYNSKRGGFVPLVHFGCSLSLRQSAQKPERATSKWISECSGRVGTRRSTGPLAAVGPAPPLKRGTTGTPTAPRGAHAEHPALDARPFPEALFGFPQGWPWIHKGMPRRRSTKRRCGPFTKARPDRCKVAGRTHGRLSRHAHAPQAIAIGFGRHCFRRRCQHERPARRLHPRRTS